MNTAAPLPGRQLALRAARWVLLALVAATALAVLASLVLAPAYIPSHIQEFGLTSWEPEQKQAALAELGWPPSTVAWFSFIRNLVHYLGTFVPGLLILRRKSHDWFGLYVAFAFMVVPALSAMDPLVGLLPGLRVVLELTNGWGWQLYFILFYVFPDGQFVPRWTRWLLPLWVGINLLPWAFGVSEAGPEFLERFRWLVLIPFPLVFIAIGSQIYRYFRRSNTLQRQQTKWVVLALVVTMVSFPLGPAIQSPSPDRALGTTLMLELGRLAALGVGDMVVPIAIAIAVLRYRLWDIDVIIRRTLVYTAFTGLLALSYFGSVLLLQSVFARLTGDAQTSLVTVLSTLLIAALVVPVRARVQATIDRRFYRRKYDAARTLARFGEQARDETDLGRLSERLTGVVQETMQPEHVGLWLRPGVDGGRTRSEK